MLKQDCRIPDLYVTSCMSDTKELSGAAVGRASLTWRMCSVQTVFGQQHQFCSAGSMLQHIQFEIEIADAVLKSQISDLI